jgi:putative Holliday junction resolvase
VESGQELGRVAALDYGQARIGVAVSDELGLLAHLRPFVPARPPQRALRLLKELFAQEEVKLVLVGLARNMDGSEGLSARRCRKFALQVGEATGISVELIDERLSTVEAGAKLRDAGQNARGSKGKIDSASAAVILQSWLDVSRGASD